MEAHLRQCDKKKKKEKDPVIHYNEKLARNNYFNNEKLKITTYLSQNND